MMRISIAATAFSALLVNSAFADEHRELGPHEHGHGTVNIAIEGNTAKMELEAPGDDIAGFEHDPSTPEEKKTIEEVKAKLAKPLDLFQPSMAAKCTAKGAKVEIVEEKHEAGEEAKDEHGAEAHHNAFQAEYTLECAAISELKDMSFAYFEAFKNAQGLTVNVITSKGQSKFEVSRSAPKLDLSSVM